MSPNERTPRRTPRRRVRPRAGRQSDDQAIAAANVALVAAAKLATRSAPDQDARRSRPHEAGLTLDAIEPFVQVAQISREFLALLNDLRLDGRNGWTRSERGDGAVLLEKLLSTGKRAVFLLMPPGGGDSRRLS